MPTWVEERLATNGSSIVGTTVWRFADAGDDMGQIRHAEWTKGIGGFRLASVDIEWTQGPSRGSLTERISVSYLASKCYPWTPPPTLDREGLERWLDA